MSVAVGVADCRGPAQVSTNNDGSGVKRLTNNMAHDGLPKWSPDGKSIAFVSDQGGGWAVWISTPSFCLSRLDMYAFCAYN